jgi:hypothetical protein
MLAFLVVCANDGLDSVKTKSASKHIEGLSGIALSYPKTAFVRLGTLEANDRLGSFQVLTATQSQESRFAVCQIMSNEISIRWTQ